jgi:hypothetical protein
MLRKASFIIFLAFSVYLPASAQVNMKDSALSGFLIQASYAAQLPAGNLAQRFGFNNNIGLTVLYKTPKNWLLGIQGAYIFGNVLKESNILDSIATSDGNIIANDGSYPQVTYFERGWDIELSVGKLFPWGHNPSSGIMVLGSVGYIQHFINIQIQGGEYTPQLTGDYLNGYDRLTAGACITEFVGYMYLGNNRVINFFAGFEFTQGFTKSLRYDFNTMQQNTNLRYDLLNGIRAGWILPIFKSPANAFYTK